MISNELKWILDFERNNWHYENKKYHITGYGT